MEQRKHTHRPGETKNGKSTVFVTCPFCQEEVEAYVWSMAGSGKRCPKCGAVHKWNSGMSIRKDASQQNVQRTCANCGANNWVSISNPDREYCGECGASR